MTKRIVLLFGVLGAVEFLLFPSVAGAWEAITNPPSVWRRLPVPYWINQAGCADIGGYEPTVAVCEAAWDAWESPSCTSWRVSLQGPTTASSENHRDSLWVLGWIESGWEYGYSAIGITACSFWAQEIMGCDISLNAVHYKWSLTGIGGWNTVDTQSILTHEMGHFLGLNDVYSCRSDPETMCGYYVGGTALRTLTDDDVAGVCALYPGTGPQPECSSDSDCLVPRTRCFEGRCVGDTCHICVGHDQCGDADDYCLAFPDGFMYCGRSCLSDADCGGGGVCCVDLGGGIKQCRPANFDCVSPPSPCSSNRECPVNHECRCGGCVYTPPTCTTDDQCEAGLYCKDGVCVPDDRPRLPVCADCTVWPTADDPCGGEDDLCVTQYPDGQYFVDGRSYCGQSCESMGWDCGPGFSCFEFPDGRPAQCLPESRSCRHCDPVSFMILCDDGYYCDFVNCATGICRPGSVGTKLVGELCESDTECASGRCERQITGAYCSAACRFSPGWDDCYAFVEPFQRMTCEPLDFGACGYCSCDRGRLGERCESDSDCQSGSCLVLPPELGEGKVCSMPFCNMVGTCPSKFVCAASPDGTYGCFPASPSVKKPGDQCFSELDDCLGGWCDVEKGYCTRFCDGNCRCPINMRCEKDALGREVCRRGEREALKSGCGDCMVAASGPELVEGAILWMLMMLFLSGIVLRRRMP